MIYELVWSEITYPHPTTHFLVRLWNWTKLSMIGPQLFSGWYQMILDVFRCSQLFSDVFSWVVTFMDNHPLCGHFFSGCPQLITDILYRFSDVFKICSDVLRCSQMFSDDHRCFWIFSRYSIDVLLMFSRCSLDVPRMIAGFFQDDHFKWNWIELNLLS